MNRLFRLTADITEYFLFQFRAAFKFRKNRKLYLSQSRGKQIFLYTKKNEFKILDDYNACAGTVDSHYFLQDIFVAKYIIEHGFKNVHDVGSRVDGFIAHCLSGGVQISLIDIRPFPVAVENLEFIQGNAMDLSSVEDNSIPILTSLHAIEHFGLGRYGDPIDYEGWKKALRGFVSKVKHGGTLIVSVPVGNKDKLMFNAHRIFRPSTIYSAVSNEMFLESFTRIYDYSLKTQKFAREEDVSEFIETVDQNLGDYDCGIFIFKKK